MYAHLDQVQRRFPLIDVVNPAIWELGHLGWFQEYWCVRGGPQGANAKPSRYPGADELWNSSLVPHDARWDLPLPRDAGLREYLDATLEASLRAMRAHSDADACYFFTLALHHEDMHGEALLMTLQTLQLPAPPWLDAPVAAAEYATRARNSAADITIPEHEAVIGSSPSDEARRFVFDNEKWAHRVHLGPFRIAASCVTNAEFRAFVEDGGYDHPKLWSDEACAWLRAAKRTAPAYWSHGSGEWRQRWFADLVPIDWDAPVQHVNAYEADAWCRWAGRRLPIEQEWEAAARLSLSSDATPAAQAVACNLDAALGHPVPTASSDTHLAHMLGNVWEWTASAFLPYPGFAPDPYVDYSLPWFGSHRTLRGGSWATRARLVHERFRNFYMPNRYDAFAGFRTCAIDL